MELGRAVSGYRPPGAPTRDLYRLIEHASDYLVALDADGRFSFVSPSVERGLGYRAAEILGRSSLELVHPDDVNTVRSMLGPPARLETVQPPTPIRFRAADGSYRVIEAAANNLLDDPSVAAVVVTGRDVTEGRRAEARFRAVFDSSAVGMALLAPDGTIVESNGAFARMLGYELDELRGRSYASLTHPEDVGADATLAAEVFSGERDGDRMERRLVHKDGGTVWGRLTFSVIAEPDASGLALAVVEDITAEKTSEAERARAEQRYRTLVETMPAVTYVWESAINAGDALVTYTSPQIDQLLGFTAEEWERDPMFWLERVHPDDRDMLLAATERSERDGTPFELEYRYLARDGRVVWVRDVAVLLERAPDGRPWRFQGVMMDVTETRRAQRRIAEAERRYRSLVEQLPAITYLDRVVSTGGVIRYECLYVSPQVEALLGYSQERWASELLWERVLHPDDRDRALANVLECTRTEQPIDVEYRLIADDGRVVWIREQSLPLREGDDLYWQGVMFDVTAAKHAELALRAAEERFRTLVEQIPAVTFTDDDTPTHASIYISPQIQELLGVDAEAAMGDPDLFRRHMHPDDDARVWTAWDEALRRGTPFEAEYRVVHRDGSIRWVWERSTVLRSPEQAAVVQGVIFDVTERKLAEDVLRQSEAEVRRSLEVLKRTDEERRELLRHVVAADAAARGRLAEGIEDRSLQDITAVGLRLEALRRGLDDPEQRGAVDRLGETVQQALERLRHLLVELRPRELDTEGLAAAVERYALAVAPSGVAVDVRNGLADEPVSEVRALAYRVAQDAVSRALEGDGRGALLVQVGELDGGTLVRVGRDDASAEAPAEDEPVVASMRERAAVAGGWLRVGRIGDRGRCLEFWLPGAPTSPP